jgi:hypothetical protein
MAVRRVVGDGVQMKMKLKVKVDGTEAAMAVRVT